MDVKKSFHLNSMKCTSVYLTLIQPNTQDIIVPVNTTNEQWHGEQCSDHRMTILPLHFQPKMAENYKNGLNNLLESGFPKKHAHIYNFFLLAHNLTEIILALRGNA